MKTNELMIGDWVKVLPISNKVKPHYDRIESIRKEYTGQISIEGGYHDREHNELKKDILTLVSLIPCNEENESIINDIKNLLK